MIIHLYRGEDEERRTEGQEDGRRGGEEERMTRREDLRRTKGQGSGGEVNKR